MSERVPQADVRIVGGKTTVKLRAAGRLTVARMKLLLLELQTNAATHPTIPAKVRAAHQALIDLTSEVDAEQAT